MLEFWCRDCEIAFEAPPDAPGQEHATCQRCGAVCQTTEFEREDQKRLESEGFLFQGILAAGALAAGAYLEPGGKTEEASVGVELAALLNQRYTPEIMAHFPGDEVLWAAHLRDLAPARVHQLCQEVEWLVSLDEAATFEAVNRLYRLGDCFISPPEELGSWLQELRAYLGKHDMQTLRQQEVSQPDVIVIDYYTRFFGFVAAGLIVLLLAFLKAQFSIREEAAISRVIGLMGLAILAYPVLFVPLFHRFGEDIRTRYLLFSRRLSWSQVRDVTWQSKSTPVYSIMTAGIALLKPQFSFLLVHLTSGRTRSLPCAPDTAATIANMWRRRRKDDVRENPFGAPKSPMA